MIVLCGKTCSGKTTIAKLLEKEGMHRVVTYTTRPMRPGEIDGVDYHFLTDEEFDRMLPEFAEIAEYNAKFGRVKYASAIKDYLDDSAVIVLNPSGINQIRAKGLDPIVIELDVDESSLRDRLSERGDKSEEVNRRLKADYDDFKEFNASGGPTHIITIEPGEEIAQTLEKVKKFI